MLQVLFIHPDMLVRYLQPLNDPCYPVRAWAEWCNILQRCSGVAEMHPCEQECRYRDVAPYEKLTVTPFSGMQMGIVTAVWRYNETIFQVLYMIATGSSEETAGHMKLAKSRNNFPRVPLTRHLSLWQRNSSKQEALTHVRVLATPRLMLISFVIQQHLTRIHMKLLRQMHCLVQRSHQLMPEHTVKYREPCFE